MNFWIKSRGVSDKGMVRQSNQDSYYLDPSPGLFMVADGMGGHAGGELASQMGTQIISTFLRGALTEINRKNTTQILGTMDRALNLASTKIYERALEEPQYKGMGTTVTLLHIAGDQAFCAHVGDSRLYLLRSGFIFQLTSDHSLVWEQVDAGLITEEEARKHQLRNVITRSIGYQESEVVDTNAFSIKDHDFMVLCSDGLHGKVSDSEICHVIYKYEEDAVDPLIDMANERGGEDNITVIVIKICSERL